VAEIYHMIESEAWAMAQGRTTYEAPSLATEGFIHCTAGERNLVAVANRHYAHSAGDWLVLVLDPARITSEVRWELQPDAMVYPHIYGLLILDAVVEVCSFPRSEDGTFGHFRSPPR